MAMDKYRIAVCDDDETVRNQLCAMCGDILRKKGINYSITPFSSAAELDGKANRFDLLLLDIKMNGKTGMEFAKSLRSSGNRISIIFITGSEDYLLEGYSVQPINYLLKPVSQEVLEKALETDLQINQRSGFVYLKAGGRTVSLPADKITHFESFNHSVTAYMTDKTASYPVSLTVVQGQLSGEPRFFRCHKSYIVNMDHVNEISRGGVLLSTGVQIPTGRSYYDAFQRAFVKYLNR